MKQEFPYYSRFADLWDRLGAKGPAQFYYLALDKEYSKPYRFHHTLGKHIIPMLDEFSEVSNLVESPEVVELAIWYHDVSDPCKRGHEDTSAAILYETCTGGAGLEAIAEMGRSLVLSTREHVKSQDLTAMLLGDCDYAILGKPRWEFEEYDSNIRKEYSLFVTVANWPRFEERRRELLERLRGGVFLTPYFIEKYEAQARKNIEWALKKTDTSLPGRKAVRKKPVRKKPVRKKPVRKKPVRKKPVRKKPVREKPAEEKRYLLRELLPRLHPYYDPDFDEESGPPEPLGGLGLLDHWFEFEPEEKDERPGGRSGMFDHWFEFD